MSDQDFDLAGFDSADEAMMTVKHPGTGEPTTWVWTFYGPGHAKTVELSNRISREQLKEEREKEQARVNGRKWKGEDRAPEELLARNVANIVSRVKEWTPVKIGAETLTYSPEATAKLLLDRKKGWLLQQISEFLRDDASFMPTSATS